MKSKKVKVNFIIIFAVIILLFVLYKFFKIEERIESDAYIVIYNTNNFEQYSKQLEIIIPNKKINFKNKDDIENIIMYLKELNENFNEKNYEITLDNENIENQNVQVVNFEYKIEEFYTNSGYKAVIENGKVSKIVAQIFDIHISEETYNKLKEMSKKKDEYLSDNFYYNQALKKANLNNAKVKEMKLFYNLENDNKYKWIIIENEINGKKEIIQKSIMFLELIKR